MNRPTKLDLTLFHKLVKELEDSLEEAYEFRDSDLTEKNIDNYYEFVVKVSKSLGYLAGIVNEATLLGTDLNKLTQSNIHNFLKGSSSDPTKSLQDYIKSLGEVFSGGNGGGTPGGTGGGNVN